MPKIPTYRWPPTHRLPAARYSADLKQLQNRDFATSNRSKPIRVLTRTKSSYSEDRLPIGYMLRNFQPIWSNFIRKGRRSCCEIFQLQVLTCTKSPRTGDCLPRGYSLPDFQLFWNNFKIEIFQLQIALNPYEFWRARNARVAMIAYP